MIGTISKQQQGSSHLVKIHPSFVTGFVQADGCFHVSFYRNTPSRTGFRMSPTLFVTQRESTSSELLNAVRERFACGNIVADKRDSCRTLQIHSIRQLQATVLPHFEAYPLLPGKQADYLLFREVVGIMSSKQHLTDQGWTHAVDLGYQMNLAGKRRRPKSELLAALPGGASAAKLSALLSSEIPSWHHKVMLATDPHYISGVVQGDGGFSVGFRGSGRVDLYFSVGMSNNSLPVLRAIRDYLGCGKIFKVSPSYSRLMVTDLHCLIEKVNPHFESYPLWDDKGEHCKKFAKVCGLIAKGACRGRSGLSNLVEIAYDMNMSGKRRRVSKEEYLRGVLR